MSIRSIVQTTPKYGQQIRTEPSCKICQNPHRAEIEDILALRSMGKLMDNGIKPTEAWIRANAEALWGMKLYPGNMATHLKKHFRPGDVQTEEIARKDTRTEMRDLLEEHGIPRVTADQLLEAIVGITYQKLLIDPSMVTVDQGLKAIAELTKRKHDDATADLMRLLGEAQARALGQAGSTLDKAIERIPHPNGSEPPDEIEAEVVEDGDEPSQ